MIDRYEEDKIIDCTVGNVVFHFYFDKGEDDRERRIAKVIILLNTEEIAQSLIQQLHDELKSVCRTELVTEVWIDVSDTYYPISGGAGGDSSKMPCVAQDAINIDFYTDYVIKGDTGFVCPATLGRFSRKQRRFTEISNSMLSRCEVQY